MPLFVLFALRLEVIVIKQSVIISLEKSQDLLEHYCKEVQLCMERPGWL